MGGANDGPKPPLSVGEMKNNNQLAMRACDKKSKGGKGMAAGTRVAGSDKEGEGGEEGNVIGNKGGVKQRG